MFILTKKSVSIRPRFFIELIILIYLLAYGPLSPLLPLAVGYRSISDDLNTVYYTGDNIQTALNVLSLTGKIQQEILQYWDVKGLYPGGVRVYLSPASRYYHSSMYNKNSTAFIQGDSIVINLENGREYLSSILKHEMSHHYISQLALGFFTRYYLPRWLDEGMAVVISGAETSSRGRLVNYLKHNPDPVSIDNLNSGIQWYRSFQTAEWEISYIYSREIVDYLLKEYGKDKFLELISDLGIFYPANRAIKEILGISSQELEEKFLTSVLKS